MQGFHDDLVPLPDIPIAMVATVWTDPMTGRGYVLIIHEALYFGGSMNHTLINPNQLRQYGIPVHDNPYDRDPSRAMGIKINDDERLPFLSQGSTIFFNSRYPDDDELEAYPHVILMSDTPWDPHRLIMPGGLDESGMPTTDRIINEIQSDIQRGTNRHHNIYETDCVCLSVDGNTEQLLMERIIKSVNVTTRESHKLQSQT